MSSLNELLKSNAALPIAKEVILNLAFTNNFISDKLSHLFKTNYISGQQYNVLRILRGQKGNPVNLQTIQERMVHKNSNTGRLIDKLVVKDLVNRKQCPENRRQINLTITPLGLSLLDTIDPKLDAIESDMLNKLSLEEAKTLCSLLEKFRS